MKRYVTLTLALLLALSTAACARTAATVREMAPDEQAMVYVETVVPQELDRTDFTFCCGAQVWLRQDADGPTIEDLALTHNGFVTTKGKDTYAVLPPRQAAVEPQPDGSVRVLQDLAVYKENAPVYLVSLGMQVAYDEQSGQVRATALPVTVTGLADITAESLGGLPNWPE